MFFVGMSQPVIAVSLQVVRYLLFPAENTVRDSRRGSRRSHARSSSQEGTPTLSHPLQAGNRVFVTDIYTSFVIVFVCA